MALNHLQPVNMLTNYIISAFRHIQTRRGYSMLNIAGLSIGMICCLLIFNYVSYEKSYDRFEPAADRIFRVQLNVYHKEALAYRSATSYPAIAPTMQKDFPEIENYCRLIDNNLLLANEEQNKNFSENKGYFADPATIQMFGLRLLKGDPTQALSGPNKIILSESMAKKYFGTEEPVGKTLVNRSSQFPELLQVTGVYKDLPANSHLILKYLVSYATLSKELALQGDRNNVAETAWGWYDFYVYLQLKPGADVRQLEAKLPAFTETYINSNNYNKENHKRVELHLTPLSNIHLYSNVNQEAEVNGNGQAVSSLFWIAIIIICIAWVNYVNLSTARSVERAKEVGVRKVMGVLRMGLIKQFFVESLLINLISLAISVAALLLLIPVFNRFAGLEAASLITLSPSYWLLFALLFFAGTLLSGLYPAFVLSGFKPILVLKGAFKNSSRGLILRKSLIIAQFVTSVVLIASTIIIYQQVNYMRSQQLGADINETIVLRGPQSLHDSTYHNVFQPFKSALLKQAGIKTITTSSDVPGNEIYSTSSFGRTGVNNAPDITLYQFAADVDFVPAYNIKLTAGRNFSASYGGDKTAVILNETAIAELGFKDAASAINQQLRRGKDTLTIVGVAADFHQQGLQKAIDPIVILNLPDFNAFYSIKVDGHNMQQTLATLKTVWSTYFPKDPFDYFFLDQSYARQYEADQQFGKIFGTFAFLAILIACFGLLGLSAYNIYQRTKEIGIRKVLGASAQSILVLLSKDFIALILIALVIAIPITWYVMTKWLQDYYFRITIAWWVFIIAGLAAVIIVLTTISIQAVKAVVTNPVKSLKTE